MKRILFLLLLTVSVYGQNPSRFAKIQITGNSNSGTATKVNVQEANGDVNTQTINTGFNKNIGLGGSDVVGANTLLNQYSTTPVDWTATAFNSGQVVFYGGKQWISKTATVAGDVPAASSKWEEITFDALANKTTTVDQTIIDGSTNAVSSNAVFDGLATKFPTPTGLTTNYLPKWNGSGFGNSQIFDNGTNIGIGTTTPNAKFDVAGVIRSSFIDSYPSIEAFNQGTVGFPLFQLRNIKNSVEKFWNIENGRTVNGDLGFYNEGGQRITFTTNGRILINKTDDDLTNQLQVAGTISASPATTANQVVVKSQLDAVAARPYKVYTALLSQTGTNAPTATVLENTLGGTVVWTRFGTGVYKATLSNAFTSNKTFLLTGLRYSAGATYSTILTLLSNTASDVQLMTTLSDAARSLSDGLLTGDSIEIRVYN